ncbi:unnamed protein product [Lactuca virosa]|uniref:Uncharacterized protein n=1 Tax=Lactuca virosa TaxID=75947 RepID=A0AAU9NM77_9ASTR|nr:unnamed protein product [Lactuca virosa]
MAEDDTPLIEVHNGNFLRRPFMYFDPNKNEMRCASFKYKGYSEFVAHLDAITRRMCKDIYYCPNDQTLCQGLSTLHKKYDYHEFLKYLREKEKVNVYVYHMHEPLFDCIEMVEPKVEDDTNSNEDEDDDSLLVDKEGYAYEVDDKDVSMKTTRESIQHRDMFLNKLYPDVEEEEVPNVEKLPPANFWATMGSNGSSARYKIHQS